MIDRNFLEKVRRILIQLLNAIDDALEYPRTIPSKEEREKEKRLTRHKE